LVLGVPALGTTTPYHFGETISTDRANYFPYRDSKKGV
jgi:hypothetical protein